MNAGDRIAEAALALIGTPFRLRGRSATTGVDCVGLVTLAVERAGLRTGPAAHYHLRGMSAVRGAACLARAGLVPASGEAAGDVLLVEPGPLQLHLMVATRPGSVHAHAGLRRVVLTPWPASWPVLGRWRIEPEG